MFKALANWLSRRKGKTLPAPNDVDSNHPTVTEGTTTELESIETNPSRLVPYDENLLERSRTQWQFGDWESLARLEREILQHHPDRAKLALLAAAGHQQLGNMAAARQFTRLAQDWGCSKKLVSQILIAGMHNTLGRVAVITNQESRAFQHFGNTIALGMPGADVRLLTQARITQQISQLGLTHSRQHQHELGTLLPDNLKSSSSVPADFANPIFSVKKLAHLDLGDAWAGNTINTVVFRHHGIVTLEEYQYTAFYKDKQTLRLVKRCLNDDTVQTHDIEGQYNLLGAHNSISLGYDRQGFLHLTYDHHGTQLHYRRALMPHAIGAWSDEIPMTGAYEEKVTYPTFILPRHGYPLTLLYRDGVWNKGSARLKSYDEAAQAWIDYPTPILSGAEEKPWTCNAYWNHPAVGNDGSLHLSFVWRTDSLGDEQLINNINIGYAYSNDNGINWRTSRDRLYKLPITPVNAETVYPVSPGSNLINQCSMALDSQNRPHIVFYSNDESGIPQYQHLRFDGARWHHQYLSNRKAAFDLKGGGTLQIPISRPDIIMDKEDNAYIIFRGDLSHNKLAMLKLKSPAYSHTPGSHLEIWHESLGYAEPIIDRMRWSKDEVLSLLIQHNDQPNHDMNHLPTNHSIQILDVEISSLRRS